MSAESHYVRVALVTGAGRPRGIGAATAIRLARDGYAVTLTDQILDGDAGLEVRSGLQSIADQIRQAGGRVLVKPLDVTDPSRIDEVVQATVDSFGALSVVVNNAGTGIGVGPFGDIDDARWELSWQVNVMGAVRVARAALPHLMGGGSIVNVASTAGIAAEAGYGAYTVTKHAVVGLTRLLATELGQCGIRVNAIAPGMIHTDLGAAELALIAYSSGTSIDDAAQMVADGIPLGRLGAAVDVAEAVAWLAGPASGFVSGAILPVHGAAASGLS